MSCVMRTGEMESHSYLEGFSIDNDAQVRRLCYSYTSRPKASLRERSTPHDGTMLFSIIGKPVHKLEGEYWTQRQTSGTVTLTFRINKLLDEIPRDLPAHPVTGKSHTKWKTGETQTHSSEQAVFDGSAAPIAVVVVGRQSGRGEMADLAKTIPRLCDFVAAILRANVRAGNRQEGRTPAQFRSRGSAFCWWTGTWLPRPCSKRWPSPQRRDRSCLLSLGMGRLRFISLLWDSQLSGPTLMSRCWRSGHAPPRASGCRPCRFLLPRGQMAHASSRLATRLRRLQA
jgi:hypothetical protein